MLRGYSMNIDLYVNYYNSRQSERQEEIRSCIDANIANAHIDYVYIITFEYDSYIQDISSKYKKVRVIHLNDCIKLSYHDFIRYAKDYGGDNSISVFANVDIIFDETINNLKSYISDNDFICISRLELGPNNNWQRINNPHQSQDAWCIKNTSLNSIDLNLLNEISDIKLGSARCDMKVAALFFVYGWNVVNLCNFINIKHIHTTKSSRHYSVFNSDCIGLNAEVFPILDKSEKSRINLLCSTIRKDLYQPKVTYTNWIGSHIKMAENLDSINTYKLYNQVFIVNDTTIKLDVNDLYCLETTSNSYFHFIIEETQQKLVICPGRNIHFIVPQYGTATLRILTDSNCGNMALLVSHFHRKPQI